MPYQTGLPAEALSGPDSAAVPAGMNHEPPLIQLRALVEAALTEDLGRGDVTTESLVPADLLADARIIARVDGVIAGLTVARLAFELTEPRARVELLARDGDRVTSGEEVARITGPARGILSAERVALNFLQRLSGTATLAARYVEAVEGTGARIVDTRKTTPGLRLLEKYAVRCGGASNHRYDLGAAVMAKDNHLAALAAAGLSLPEAIRRARAQISPTIMIEIEVDRLDQLDEVLAAEPDLILLDNMTPDQLIAAVEKIGGRARTEASGGITLEEVRRVAETGVDMISVGALTHSAPALDLSLDFVVKGN
jgi:nicotinate-nucleotide pyrophosphorylase (carboxylating)